MLVDREVDRFGGWMVGRLGGWDIDRLRGWEIGRRLEGW